MFLRILIFKPNWPFCIGYIAHAKYPKNKVAKNVSTNPFKLFYAKNGCKKKLNKWDHFENCQKWPQSKGYSPCKLLRKEWPKTCQKRFYKHIQNVLCKKRLQKTANTEKKDKNGNHAKAIAHPNTKKKNCQTHNKKRFYNTLQLFYAKKARKNS